MKKWLEYRVSELFSNRKCRGLGPWLVDQHRARWGLREGELEVWGSSPGAGWPFIGQRRGGGGRVPSMTGVEGVLMLLD
jgi:hypothetical protein